MPTNKTTIAVNKTTQQRTIYAKLIIVAITKGNAPIFSNIGGGRSQDQS